MRLLLCLALVLLLAGCQAHLPSDLVTARFGPDQINLHNVSPSSAKAISDSNEALVPWQSGLIPNLGHYTSEAEKLVGENGIPMNLTNYTASIPVLPMNVGNATNATNVTEINGTMVWL